MKTAERIVLASAPGAEYLQLVRYYGGEARIEDTADLAVSDWLHSADVERLENNPAELLDWEPNLHPCEADEADDLAANRPLPSSDDLGAGEVAEGVAEYFYGDAPDGQLLVEGFRHWMHTLYECRWYMFDDYGRHPQDQAVEKFVFKDGSSIVFTMEAWDYGVTCDVDEFTFLGNGDGHGDLVCERCTKFMNHPPAARYRITYNPKDNYDVEKVVDLCADCGMELIKRRRTIEVEPPPWCD